MSWRTRASTQWRCTSASRSPTSRTPPTCCAASTTSGATASSRFEVAPTLADDTDGTLAQARDYWARLDRPNVMIKIPGTEAGVPAIEQAIYEGINVNVTLLFGVERYAADRRGLHPRARAPRTPRAAARDPLGRELLRVARRHRGRQAARRARPQRPRRQGRARQRARRLRSLRADLPRRALRGAAAAGRSSSGRCGPRPASRTRPTPRRSTSIG
jgi:hypothetical protein